MTDAISVLAFITTICFSFSQAYIIFFVKRNSQDRLKTTSSFSIISCLFYQLIWFVYYIKKENNNICWCYLIGIIFSYIWISIYLYYYSKETIESQYLYLFLYIFTMTDLILEISYIEIDILVYQKDSIVKIISCIFNVLMYITPGLKIFSLLNELNKEYIFFPITIIGLFNSSIWLLYAIISNDKNNKTYYLCSNIFGISFCIMQIIFYLVFKNKKIDVPDKPMPIKEEHLISDTDSKSSHKKKKKIKKKIKKESQKEENEDLLNII